MEGILPPFHRAALQADTSQQICHVRLYEASLVQGMQLIRRRIWLPLLHQEHLPLRVQSL